MPRPSLAIVLIAAGSACSILHAQQATPVAVQPVQPVQAALPPAQPPFVVAPAHQAWLDQVLAKWQKDSDAVTSFYCDFERYQHVAMLGPADGRPYKQEKGKLGYTKPDQGSIKITEHLVWTPQQQAAAPNAPAAQPEPNKPVQGTYEVPKDGDGKPEPGEHWVSNGKNVYQYKSRDKQLVVTPIPPQLQGKQIVDGPLPFLFGADTKKLKERFWLRPAAQLCNEKLIGIHAKPKRQQDAANYSDVWVVLRNEPGKKLIPAGLRILHPDKSWHEYRFDLKNAQINPVFAGMFAKLFQEPRTPLGWKRVVEPMRQAQAPQPPQR